MLRSKFLQRVLVGGQGNPAFQMLVKTDNVGTSNNDQFTIPTNPGLYTYNYDVDWGDGNNSTGLTGDATHTYASAGEYVVKITGTFPAIYFNNSGDKQKVLKVTNWGDIEWTSFNSAFYGCVNMTEVGGGTANTSSVTDMARMFYNCSSVTGLDVTSFDTSSVTDMNNAFRALSSLTSLDVSGFNTSSVTNMNAMFFSCSSLTSLDVTGFDTSLVTDIRNMFDGCTSLTNFDPSGFNVTSVTRIANFANGTNMGTTVYDQLLVNWEAQAVNNNLSPNFGNAQYSAGSAAATARQALIDDHSWAITDGGSV